MASYNPLKGNPGRGTITYKEYFSDENGEIKSRDVTTNEEMFASTRSTPLSEYLLSYGNKEQDSLASSIAESQKALGTKTDKKVDDFINVQGRYGGLANQISSLASGGGASAGQAGPGFNNALSQLSAERNYGSSDLGSKLNFQVSDQQIIDDYNNSKSSKLNSVIERGNAQIAGISERLKTANELLAELPANSAERKSSEVFIKQLNDDLNSVTSAVTSAQDMQKNFTPITMDSPDALKEITSLRSFLQLPEERASQQLYQIDPDSYNAAVGLGRQYRDMVNQPLGATTT